MQAEPGMTLRKTLTRKVSCSGVYKSIIIKEKRLLIICSQHEQSQNTEFRKFSIYRLTDYKLIKTINIGNIAMMIKFRYIPRYNLLITKSFLCEWLNIWDLNKMYGPRITIKEKDICDFDVLPNEEAIITCTKSNILKIWNSTIPRVVKEEIKVPVEKEWYFAATHLTYLNNLKCILFAYYTESPIYVIDRFTKKLAYKIRQPAKLITSDISMYSEECSVLACFLEQDPMKRDLENKVIIYKLDSAKANKLFELKTKDSYFPENHIDDRNNLLLTKLFSSETIGLYSTRDGKKMGEFNLKHNKYTMNLNKHKRFTSILLFNYQEKEIQVYKAIY